jgi:ketosteroid isomerase-like protein
MILVALALAPHQQNQDTPDVKELVRLETVWNDAHQNGDATALDKLWADDLEVTVPKMPVMSKADVLGFAKSGRMKFQRYQTSDLKVRIYGDAAVVSGRLQRTRTLNGKTLHDNWNFLKVYVRQNGRWLVVAFQASDAAQP